VAEVRDEHPPRKALRIRTHNERAVAVGFDFDEQVASSRWRSSVRATAERIKPRYLPRVRTMHLVVSRRLAQQRREMYLKLQGLKPSRQPSKWGSPGGADLVHAPDVSFMVLSWHIRRRSLEVVSKPVLTYFSLLKLENDCTAQPEKAATQRYSRALVVPLHPAWPVLMRG